MTCFNTLHIATTLMHYAIALIDLAMAVSTLWQALRTMVDVCAAHGPLG